MAKKKKTAAQFVDDAESNGLESLNKANIDGDTVSKHLESGTEINYNRMLSHLDVAERPGGLPWINRCHQDISMKLFLLLALFTSRCSGTRQRRSFSKQA